MWNKTLKLFQNYFRVFIVWNYFKIIAAAKIISATLNVLEMENIHELQ